MRTATVVEFGGPDVFRMVEVPDLLPGAGEVLVDVEFADTLWLETMVRSGRGRDYWPMRPPYVPGNGVAGRVLGVGPGVDPGWAGRRVVAHTGTEGGYADRVLVPSSALTAVPDQVELSTAAALLHDGTTAEALFELTHIGPRDTVVVVGASGGLGIVSVQLARARADRVVAAARGSKLDRVRALRPDVAVDTEDPDWVARVRHALGGDGVDVILDNVGGDLGEASFDLLRAGGRFSSHGTPSGRFASVDPERAATRGVTIFGIRDVQFSAVDRTRFTEQALAEAAEGILVPVIGQTFPLERAGEAHAAIESRTVFGKTLLTVG
ncbi:MAG: zinc-binding dehydrogenase [Propionibacteriaceae bacterium]